MVRIKGANSDYVFDLKEGQIQEQKGDHPVYLKIFICPYDMPSRVEEPHDGKAGNWCEGTAESCPKGHKSIGHALVSLHQEEGIKLVTDNGNQLVVNNETGNIQIQPVVGGRAEVDGNFLVQSPHKDVLLEVSTQQIALQLGETKVIITEAGDIELSTRNGEGEIAINGSLTVQGNVKTDKNLAVNGNVTLQGDLQVNKSVDINGDATLHNNLKVQGGLEVMGKVTGNLDLTSVNIQWPPALQTLLQQQG